MSDSEEDNVYSDYLASRRAIVNKKRRVVEDDDDVFDSVISTKQPVAKKERKVITMDDDSDDDDEALFAAPPVTHKEDFQKKSKQLEEEFRQYICSDDTKATETNYGRSNADMVLNLCKACELEDDTEEPSDTESHEDDTSSASEKFVEIDVLDCDITKNGQKSYMMTPNSTFLNVREQIAATWNCHVDKVYLILKGNRVDEEATPASLGVVPMKLPLTLFEAHKEMPPVEITINVRMLNRTNAVKVNVKPEMKLSEVKQLAHEALSKQRSAYSVPAVENMKVLYGDDYLTDDEATVDDMKFEEGDLFQIHS